MISHGLDISRAAAVGNQFSLYIFFDAKYGQNRSPTAGTLTIGHQVIGVYI